MTSLMIISGLMVSFVTSGPASAQANRVMISELTDVAFGTIANLQTDNRRGQSVCVGANTTDGMYSVTASGTGAGGALTLTDGSSSLPYDVEWSSNPGQTTGSNLVANTALVSQQTSEKQKDCKGVPTASLIVILRGAELSKARQGNYSGTLNILIAAQ